MKVSLPTCKWGAISATNVVQHRWQVASTHLAKLKDDAVCVSLCYQLEVLDRCTGDAAIEIEAVCIEPVIPPARAQDYSASIRHLGVSLYRAVAHLGGLLTREIMRCVLPLPSSLALFLRPYHRSDLLACIRCPDLTLDCWTIMGHSMHVHTHANGSVRTTRGWLTSP